MDLESLWQIRRSGLSLWKESLWSYRWVFRCIGCVAPLTEDICAVLIKAILYFVAVTNLLELSLQVSLTILRVNSTNWWNLQLLYVYYRHIPGSKNKSIRLANVFLFAGACMAFDKLLLVCVQEHFCGYCSLKHNTFQDLLQVYIIPNSYVFKCKF